MVDGSLFSHYCSESKSTGPPAPPQSDLADGGSSKAHGVNPEDVLNMAGISIDPEHFPSNPQKLGNQGDGVRLCRKSNIPVTHDLRKENIPIFEERAHLVDPLDPPTCPSHSSEIFRDISNADFRPSPKGPTPKGWKRKTKMPTSAFDRPKNRLPQKRGSAEESSSSGDDIQIKKQAVHVDLTSIDFVAVAGFQHRQSQ